ncbi:hypothetical protein Tco_0183405 [Tanacetum coccineum]
MPSMKTSRAMLGMSLRTMTEEVVPIRFYELPRNFKDGDETMDPPCPQSTIKENSDVGRVDGLVEEVEGLDSREAELMDKLENLLTKELRPIRVLMESVTSPQSLPNNCRTYYPLLNLKYASKGDVRNVIANNDRRGCTYKVFFVCNPKEYDGKGGAIVYTRWIEKMESV